MKKYAWDLMESPVGDLMIICSDEALHAVHFDNEGKKRRIMDDELERNPKHPMILKTRRQLGEYFAGKRTTFDLPLAPDGTSFQKLAWRQLSKIPYGKTRSYGEQAAGLGDARKARAVGAANGKNPIPIIVPCHRVIGKSGDLTGFGGGLDKKRYLLDLEVKQLRGNC